MIRDSTRRLLHASKALWLLYAVSVGFGIPSPELLAPNVSSSLRLTEMLSVTSSFGRNLFAKASSTRPMYSLNPREVRMRYCHYVWSDTTSPE